MYPKEVIPDKCSLYYRVHATYFRDNVLIPGVFRELGDGMSTDWDKYSTPEQSKARAKKPENNGIVSLSVEKLRILNFNVIHAPTYGNRAHTNVKGVNVETRLKLLDVFKWEIKIPQD